MKYQNLYTILFLNIFYFIRISESRVPKAQPSSIIKAFIPDFKRTERLDEDITVTWEVYSGIQKIIFGLEANTTGYIGFGLFEDGANQVSDFVVGGINPDKTPYFTDKYVSSTDKAVNDSTQNWKLLEGSEVANKTFLKFIRDFDTGDAQDIAISYKRTSIVWLLGQSDDTSSPTVKSGFYRVNILQALNPVNFIRTEALNENITVSWEVDYKNDNVIFDVRARTTGYIFFGISREGKTDSIVGGINNDLSPYFHDRYSVGDEEAVIDATENWLLLAAQEYPDNITTRLKFIRKFDTWDNKEDLVIMEGETNFVWALGKTDDISNHESEIKGSYSVNMLQQPPPVLPNTTIATTTTTTTSTTTTNSTSTTTTNPTSTTVTKPNSTTTTNPTGTTTTTTTTAPLPIPANFVRQAQINENLTVNWEVDFAKKLVTFDITAVTNGYIGFGIADSGTMYNADTIIGGVYPSGASYFNDRFSTKHGVPPVDKIQNWFLLSASEDDGKTKLRFVRAFDSGDKEEDFAIEDRNTTFIWAIGSSDDLKRHATRGEYKVNILEPPTIKPTEEPLSTMSTTQSTFGEDVRTAVLSPNYLVRWEVDFIRKYVTFEVEVKTVGYIGFGLCDSGNMKNADFVYCGVKKGMPYLQDMFSLDKGIPQKDGEQNWDLISGIETDGQTTMKFGRKIITSDTKHDVPIEDKNTYFVWALGDSDDLTYHSDASSRGNFSVNILRAAPISTTTPDDPDPESTTSGSGSTRIFSLALTVIMFTVCLLSKSF